MYSCKSKRETKALVNLNYGFKKLIKYLLFPFFVSLTPNVYSTHIKQVSTYIGIILRKYVLITQKP